MPWMIEKSNQIVYDQKSHKLKLATAEGDSIACIHEMSNGNLEISLAMNTDFQSEDGKLHATGWNGCEEHILAIVTLVSEGGTSDYQEGRSRYWEFEKKSQRILVNIKKVDNLLIPIPKDAPQKPKRTFLQSIFRV